MCVRFDHGQVPPGSPVFRTQHLPLSVCVQSQAQANGRAAQAVNRIFGIPPSLLGQTRVDAQAQCRARWKDMPQPPSFFCTCNDPLRVEEAQVPGSA